KIGTVAKIIRLLKMPDGTSTAIIQGKRRFELGNPIQTEPYIRANVTYLNEVKTDFEAKEMSAVMKSIRELALRIIKESPTIPSEASMAIKNIDSPSFLLNFISSNMNADVAQK